uniref:Uncharacterized protein n=1 Tax=Lactuca sativa TaxID=4236 RepID=A0A9R1X3Q1_LACSA|nr:hypothetical protein LSAT_V11C600318340 [Lactuca sativa]
MELKCLKSLLSSLEKEYDQIRRKMEEIQEELDNESGEAAIQKLQDEIKKYKSILKCGVCFDRPKERNLENRHRKCRGYGMAFGQRCSVCQDINIL